MCVLLYCTTQLLFKLHFTFFFIKSMYFKKSIRLYTHFRLFFLLKYYTFEILPDYNNENTIF